MKLMMTTGASRGIGRALVHEMDSRHQAGLHHVLMARDETALQRIADEVSGSARILKVDLADPVRAADLLSNLLAGFDPTSFDQLILVNNAGVLGPVAHTGFLPGPDVQQALQVNLVAPMLLTDRFVRWAHGSSTPKVVLNVSSGAARFPIVCWGTYCASKAGLEMFSRVVAEEKRKDLRIISVAPGVIETDMQQSIRGMDAAQFPLRDEFIRYKETGKLKTPEQSAKELADVLDRPEDYEVTVGF